MKLVSRTPESIPADNLKNGQIAELVGGNETYHGEIVQRYGNHLIMIGRSAEHSWPDFFEDRTEQSILKVRVIKKGEKLEA